VKDVKADAGDCGAWPAASEQEGVEAQIEPEEAGSQQGGEAWPPGCDGTECGRAGDRAQAVAPARIEAGGPGAMLEQQHRPWHAAVQDVGDDHVPQAPPLEMGALDIRVEPDPTASRVETQPEVDVLHRRSRKALGVEAVHGQEGVPANGA
jgi:hypothetical protein